MFTLFASSDVPSTWAWVLSFSPHLHHLMPPAQSHHDGRWRITHISLPCGLHLHVRVQLERREVMLTPVHRSPYPNWVVTDPGPSQGGSCQMLYRRRFDSGIREIRHNVHWATPKCRTQRRRPSRQCGLRTLSNQVAIQLQSSTRPYNDHGLLSAVYPLRFAFLSPLPSLGGLIKVWIKLGRCFGVKFFAICDTSLVSVSPFPISVPLFTLVGTDIYTRYIPSIHYDLLVT